jgi:hypothetical protein
MSHRTDWFHQAGWGLFFHYLADPASSTTQAELTSDEWNRRVDSFDAKAFAAQVAEIGAPYVFLTIGQNSGFYCSPNQTYDNIVGIHPTKCSRRDLIADVARALQPYNIRTLAYLPANGPMQDEEALRKLRFTPPWDASSSGGFNNALCDPHTDARLTEFQGHWEAIIREWSLRWRELVSGWWIDGCGFADKMYLHDDVPNFASFAAALRAGNDQSIVAFNRFVVEHNPKMAATPEEDYTAGEVFDLFAICKGRWMKIEEKPVQWHTLIYAGEFWGRGEPRFPDSFVEGYTRHVIENEGVVTWDIPVSETGEIPASHVEQMESLSAMKSLTSTI